MKAVVSLLVVGPWENSKNHGCGVPPPIESNKTKQLDTANIKIYANKEFSRNCLPLEEFTISSTLWGYPHPHAP
jgi:hypothetical protein